MRGAFVDADALREFAGQLKRFSEALTENMTRTQGQVGSLGDSWRDPGYDDFRESISKTFPVLKALAEECNQTAPKLIQDAELVDEYGQYRPE